MGSRIYTDPVQEKKSNQGKFHWNNGTENRYEKECPGPEFKKGKLPDSQEAKQRKKEAQIGMKFWNNDLKEIRTKENPGPGWFMGRLKRN